MEKKTMLEITLIGGRRFTCSDMIPYVLTKYHSVQNCKFVSLVDCVELEKHNGETYKTSIDSMTINIDRIETISDLSYLL